MNIIAHNFPLMIMYGNHLIKQLSRVNVGLAIKTYIKIKQNINKIYVPSLVLHT